jgi:tryptophan halogenase
MHSQDNAIRRIAIVGGGSSGWMSAAALTNALQGNCTITLIESNDIGTVGVGEATIPPIKLFNQQLGIDEREFLRYTQGTLKYGIEFINWAKPGAHYFHPFGSFGIDFDQVPLYQYWLRAKSKGDASKLCDYSFSWHAAQQGKVVPPSSDPRLVQTSADYAYHFDAGLYAKFLRTYAEARGLVRIEGQVVSAQLNRESGFIEHLKLADGQQIDADLFIDCSGFRGLLINEHLNIGYENWSHWLPCNSAIAAPCESVGEPKPYTQSIAHDAGWQWRIPLQHRTGNGHVYCNSFMSDAQAQDILEKNIAGKIIAEPKQLRFTTGHRKQFWVKNCVAIGLAAGFMEPLESTSLHLVQTAITRLIALFPDRTFHPLTLQEYNRITQMEYEGIRDFLILHYHANQHNKSEFWHYCATMKIPDTLQYKLEHFKSYGRLVSTQSELFTNTNWLAVLIGQEINPKHYPPLVDKRAHINAEAYLRSLHNTMVTTASTMPSHQQYLDFLCGTNN